MEWTSTMKEEEVAAAVKIQAVVRGFNVRRRKPLTHLRKIASVRLELSNFQAKAADPAYIERICVDVMECRKLSEGIMSLLLQLDAIQGVHPVVRDIRKSVNREVVQFMEVIDAVVVGADTSPWQDAKNTPNIGRSNSISHIDRVASHSLKRMHSLDNCTYPEQLYKRKDDSTWNYEHQKELDGKNTLSDVGKADHSMHAPYAPNIDTVMGNSAQEGMDYHSDLESLRTLTAVLTIQSSFRGYRVRRSRPLKHLRIIAGVRAKLRELTVHVSSPNFLSKLRSDKMERLKMTESITALLLQLDSVQGVDQEIRDIRKSVTRDVIKFQEVVDTLISDLEIVEGPSALPCDVTESESDDLSVEGSPQESERSSLDDWKVAENSAGEDVPLDSLSLHSTGHESMDGKVEPTTPECDEQSNGVDHGDVSTEPSAEDICRARELERVQVRVLDRPLQNNTTASSLSESPEGNRLSDQESGPCAAVASGKDYSSGVNEEHARAVEALKSYHSMEEVSPGEAHCEDMSTPKVGNRQWHDKFVDVLDVEARACRLSESASSEDLQAQALDSIWRTTVKGRGVSFVRDTYDTLNMESLDSYQKASTREQECGMSTTAEPAGSTFQATSLEQIKSYTSAGIAQSYRSVSDDYMSDGTALSDNNTPAGIPENHIAHSGDWVSTGRNGLTGRTLIDNFFPAETVLGDNETPVGIPGNHELLIDDYVPAGPYCSAPIHRSLHEDCRPAGSAQIDHMGERKDYSSTLPDSSSIYGSIHGSNAASMNEAVLGTEQQGDVGSMDSVGQLLEENAKLRGLLNQVLVFAEMQCSKASAVMGTNEKLEAENMRYKKREEVWRKKSKSARRRR